MASKARILAIDDQLYFRSFLEGLLSEEGYEVATAESGPHALGILEHDPAFDVVITDLVMPEMDGLETVARLGEKCPDVPILVVTGVGDVRSAVAAMKLGAVDYLLKPLDREALVRALDSVLDRRRMKHENARLLDENLEFMGMLSLYERALPIAAESDLSVVAEQILDLLCVEANAAGGAIWVGSGRDEGLVRSAARGEASLESEAEVWSVADSRLDGRLRAGEPAVGPGRPGGDATQVGLWVPILRSRKLVCVARIDPLQGHAFGADAIATCTKVAEIASFVLAGSLRVRDLRRSSLRDPGTGLPTRAFLEDVARTEIGKCERYARRLSLLCIDVRGLGSPGGPDGDRPASLMADAIREGVRLTDVVADGSEEGFWVMVSDCDAIGAMVLKRRIAQRLREIQDELPPELDFALGVASYPLDGDSFEALAAVARERACGERDSLTRELALHARPRLADLAPDLLARGEALPGAFVPEMAEVLIRDRSCRPGDRGLLFLAPGSGCPEMAESLVWAVGTESATDVFFATEDDSSRGAGVYGLPLPPGIDSTTTWIVRFGEAPPYALVAGPPREDGLRAIFHSSERALVEHLALRLRSEVGLGMRP